MLKSLLVLLIGAALLLGAKPVHAAGSLSLVETAPSYGDTIHFNYTAGHGDNNLYFEIRCFQDSQFVFQAGALVDDLKDANGQLVLDAGPGMDWQSGAAECTAELYYVHSFKIQATLNFHVDP